MKAVVIGGGIGGYTCAIRLAQLGAETILVEKDQLGGTCLNRGCIPTKALLHTARLYRDMCAAEDIGISAEGVTLDHAKAMEHKDSIVAKLRGGVGFLMKKNRVRVIEGEAEFVSGSAVRVQTAGGTEDIEADAFVVATGSVPSDIGAAPRDGVSILDSTDILSLSQRPESLAVLGGGVIGCEMAQAFAMMGTKVTVIEVLPRLLANMDKDLSAVMEKTLKKDGVDVRTSTALRSAEAAGNSVRIVLGGGEEEQVIEAEKLLVSVGRKPNTDGLRLENASVDTGEKGEVIVDEYMRTSAPNIYAVGDVTGGPLQLAHTASHQGLVAAANIMGEEREWDGRFVPACVYTFPELASIGETEESADRPVSTGRFPVSANGRSMIEGCADGFAKIVTDEEDGMIIGIQIAAPFATEMISGMSGIVAFEADTDDVSDWVFAHPSVSEIIGEAVLDVGGMAIHK